MEATAPTLAAAPAQPAPTPRWARRTIAASVLGVCIAVLGLAAWLQPDPHGIGMGTHQQLHLPPCGFLATTGLPCPTCGYTTAFSYAAHGRFFAAFRTQPAGAVGAILTAIAAVLAAVTLATGASMGPLLRPFGNAWTLWIGGGIFLGGWVYKVLMVKGVI